MTDVNSISTAIVTKLGGVGGLQDVYNYVPDKPSNGRYPFATVTLSNWEGRFGDTIRNIRTYNFQVQVWSERTEAAFGNSKTETIMRSMIDEILTAFDADTTLSGVVKFVRPVKGNADYEPREVGDTRVAEFVLECVTVNPSST